MKQIPLMDREVRRDNFNIRFKNLPRELNGKTLGVVGIGRIGTELAKTCHQAFAMHILAYDPYLTPEVQSSFKKWVVFCDMERLFRESDVISLHIPFSSETKEMISAQHLSWMKPDAFLINTSRGGVIDEKALIQFLREKRIAGAGLDVFVQEPLEKESPFKDLGSSAVAAELAAMRVNREMEVLHGLGIHPLRYLVVPRVLGLAASLAALTVWFEAASIGGGLALSSLIVRLPFLAQLRNIAGALPAGDIGVSLLKSAVFGLIVAATACHQGLQAGSPITEIPQVTTRAVMQELSLVVVANLHLTVLTAS